MENTDFQFPPPPTPPTQQQCFPNFASSSPETDRQNPREKRTKMIKINNNSIIMASSSGSSTSILKPKYRKRPDPGAPKITRPCTECGKKFWSWKALFGHMRCHPERQWRGINPPPNIRRPMSPAVRPLSRLEVVMTVEDHEIATCLLMLANGDSAFESQYGTSNRNVEMGYGDLPEGEDGPSSGTGNCRFECSSCKKVFGSHQALGGHRASHKNVKGCFAITKNDGEDEDPNGSDGEDRDGEGETRENLDEKMVMILEHRCSICLRVFSSGQALGGHKRCHWEKGEGPSSLAQEFAATPRKVCGLDLNLPAPLEDNSSSSGLTLDLRLGI